MNILFVSEFFWPRPAGGEVWSWELCAALAAGHTVTVLTTRHDDSPEEQTHEGVHILRPVQSGNNRLTRKLAARKLAKVVEAYCDAHDVDLLHVMAYAMNVRVSKIAAIKGIPCVTSVHSYFGKAWNRLTWYGFLLTFLERRYIKNDTASVMHVPSAYLKEKIEQDTGKEAAIVPNWLPSKFPRPKKLTNTFVFVGSFEPVKNPLACLGVSKGRHLIMIGSGRLEKKLREKAEEEKIHLTIMNDTSRQETLAHLGGASLVLIPSVEESFSMVALEAVAQGTPVSGTKVGVMPELPGVATFPQTEGVSKLSRAATLKVRKQFSKNNAIKSMLSLYKEAKTKAKVL